MNSIPFAASTTTTTTSTTTTTTTTTTTLLLLVLVLFALAPTIVVAQVGKDQGLKGPPCLNDVDWIYKKNPSKNCAWVSALDDKKRARFCNKKQVKRACPMACDTCEYLLDKCPRNRKKMFEGSSTSTSSSSSSLLASCKDYEPGLRCDYGHRYTGCTWDTLQCSWTSRFRCEDDGIWSLVVADPFPCPSTAESETETETPFGEKCKPNWDLPTPPPSEEVSETCPASFPEDGTSCNLSGTKECFYEYYATGCAEGSRTCSPHQRAVCSTSSGKWSTNPINYLCGGSDEACDPDTYSDCPTTEPEPRSDCQSYPSNALQDCKYDYQIRGCSASDLVCLPSSSGRCDDTGKWETAALIPILCPPADNLLTIEEQPDRGLLPLLGDACSPDDCPIRPPAEGNDCGNENQQCAYGYRVQGCSTETLTCSPSFQSLCVDGTWTKEFFYAPACVANDPRWNQPCDPEDTTSECPLQPPEHGSDCSGYQGGDGGDGERCHYNYDAWGCPGNLQCRPLESYSCGEDDTWSFHPVPQPRCKNPDDKKKPGDKDGPVRKLSTTLRGLSAPPPEKRPDGNTSSNNEEEPCGDFFANPPLPGSEASFVAVCPLEKPRQGDSCADTGLTPEIGCPYDHTAIGCQPKDLKCAALSEFYCQSTDGTWDVRVKSSEQCLDVPDDWPTDVCDPLTFDPTNYDFIPGDGKCPNNEPIVNQPCNPQDVPRGCSYDFRVTGCTPEELACTGSTVYKCDEDPKLGFSWKKPGNDQDSEKCLDAPEGWPAGDSCDPRTYVAPDDFGGDSEDEDDAADGVCPDTKPASGTDCSKTGSLEEPCGYDYVVIGCDASSAYCISVNAFECLRDGNGGMQWIQESKSIGSSCEKGPVPEGECDGEIFVPKADAMTSAPESEEYPEEEEDHGCPETAPSRGASCDYNENIADGCGYNYLVFGCTYEDASCLPVSTYNCVKVDDNDNEEEQGEGGYQWELHMSRRELTMDFCPNGRPVGVCNDSEFIPADNLDDEEESDGEDDRLKPDGGNEAPDACPETPPSGGSCSVGLNCSYNYLLAGCGDDAYCMPIASYTCVEEGGRSKWIESQMRRELSMEQCLEGEEPKGSCDGPTYVPPTPDDNNNDNERPDPKPVPQDGVCPPLTPQQGMDCSRSGQIVCDYQFQPEGCGDNVRCRAQETFLCTPDRTGILRWQARIGGKVRRRDRRGLGAEHCLSGEEPRGTCNGTEWKPELDKTGDTLLGI